MITLKKLIYSDIYGYYGDGGPWLLLRELFWGIGFNYTFWMRLSKYFRNKSRLYFPAYIFSRITLRRYSFKLGIQISYNTEIGTGFYIGHFGQIVVNGMVKIAI